MNIFIDLSIQSKTSASSCLFLWSLTGTGVWCLFSWWRLGWAGHGSWSRPLVTIIWLCHAPCHVPCLGALSLTSSLLDRRTATECRMLELRWDLRAVRGRSGVRYALEIICSFRDAPHTITTVRLLLPRLLLLFYIFGNIFLCPLYCPSISLQRWRHCLLQHVWPDICHYRASLLQWRRSGQPSFEPSSLLF